MELDYKPGDVIQDFVDPFAKVLNDELKGKRCDNCFKESSSLKRCTGCTLMHYCDKKCQSQDWKLCHKFECKSDCFKMDIATPKQRLLNIRQPPLFKRQILRVFGILKLHPELGDKQFKLYSGKSRCFNDLLSHHTELYPLIEAYCAEVGAQLEKEGHGLPNSAGDGGMLSYLLKLVGIWRTNAFAILNETESCNIGSGIYIEPAIFDHSCKPDALIQLLGVKMQIRAVGPIPKGVDPHVSYLAGLKGFKERSTLLKERYHFDCKCSRCQTEEKGGDVVDYEKLNKLIQTASKQTDWGPYFKSHQEIIKNLRKIYHEYDERISNRLFLTFQEAIGLGAPTKDLIPLGKETEDHLRITFGEGSGDYNTMKRIINQLGISF